MSDTPTPAPLRCNHCFYIITTDPDHSLIVKARDPDSRITIRCLNCHENPFSTPPARTPARRPQTPAARAVAPVREEKSPP